MLQIYTGDGKGKTTAALGLAFRAVGHGLNVCIVQFLKNPEMMGEPYGEIKIAKKLSPNFTIHSFGLPHWVTKDKVTREDRDEVKRALEFAGTLLNDSQTDVIILDEIFLALHFDLVSLEELIEFIDRCPPEKELILTGRKAPQALIDRADLVTEMREVKHYFEKGVSARKGIEY